MSDRLREGDALERHDDRIRREERERAAQKITPEFFQRHKTSYQQLPQGGYFWSCSCSANFQDVLGWEECHEKTREHWSAMLAAAIRKGETSGKDNQADQ